MGASPAFFPLHRDEAADEVNRLLHAAPHQYGLLRSRWRLQDVGRMLHWLNGRSVPAIYKVLKRLGFSRKQALSFIRSSDPDYRAKWRRILRAYLEAVTHPGRVVLLFQDELTYYRRTDLRKVWQRRGRRLRRHHRQHGSNTKTRITATLDALDGRVVFRQRSKVGRKELAAFYAQVRQAYPEAEVIYLVQDNWPVHTHPDVQRAVAEQQLTLLPLPTYASWLNPIEKLWRWLRQDLLHNYDETLQLDQVRQQVVEWLDQFAHASDALLHYVGLPTAADADEDSNAIPVLNC